MNAYESILLAGVFLPPADYASTQAYTYLGGNPYIPLIESRNPELIQESIEKFEQLCLQNNIAFRVHPDNGAYALQEWKTTVYPCLLRTVKFLQVGLAVFLLIQITADNDATHRNGTDSGITLTT